MSTLTTPNTFAGNTLIKSADMNANFAAIATLINTTGLDDSNIKAGAAIARSKIGTGTINQVLINDGSGNMSSEAQLATTRGGTGVSNAGTFTYGANNLTFTTGGVTSLTLPASGTLASLAGTEILTNKTLSGASNTFSNIGYSSLSLATSIKASDINSQASTSGYVLTADGAGNAAFSAPAAAPNQSYELSNLGLSATVATNALTINLKQSDGSTAPTAGSPVKIGFRNVTATTGGYTQRSVTGATSIVVSSGASLGTISAQNQYIYVYALDNAGTVELAVSAFRLFDEGSVQSTTIMSGTATSNTVLYSTTARTNVPVRLIGRILVNEATAGTYASAPTEVSLYTSYRAKQERSEVWLTQGVGHGSTNTCIRRFVNTQKNTGTAITYADSAGLGGTFTINEDGLYAITFLDSVNSAAGASGWGISKNATSLSTGVNSLGASVRLAWTNNVGVNYVGPPVSINEILSVGDVIRAHTLGNVPTTESDAATGFRITKLSS